MVDSAILIKTQVFEGIETRFRVGRPSGRPGTTEELIERYLDAFAANDNDIGKIARFEHVIDTGDHAFIHVRERQYSTAYDDAIAEEGAL